MSRSKKIVFLNRCYWPDSEATGQLLTELCQHLQGKYEVHVICGQPNSPTLDKFVRHGIQRRDGVTIHRMKHTHFAKRIPAGRLMNIVSFSRACSRYLRRERISADVIVSETDPFLLPMVGAKHARRVGAKLVCYLQDIYPDVAEQIGAVKAGAVTTHIRAKLRRSYQTADRLVVLDEAMRNRLSSAPWQIPDDKIRVIPNWADCELIRPLQRFQNPFIQREQLQDKFVVMHSGNIGLTQRLDVLVRATQSDRWPEHAVLAIVGDGARRSELFSLACKFPNDRVRFLPYQPRESLCESLSAAHLHVVSTHENILGCLAPSKLYGILASGRPVLAIANPASDVCKLVDRHQLGWNCTPGDPDGIAKAVAEAACNEQAREAAGQRGRQIATTQFDRPVVTKLFASMIGKLFEDSDINDNQPTDRDVPLSVESQ